MKGGFSVRPNILLIITDQQRKDSLSCYGSRCVQTPAIDSLAAEGAVFDGCYSNMPLCTPARSCIFTGKPLLGHGVYRLHDILPPGEVMFPKRLQQLGYKTCLSGKLHVSAYRYEAEERHPNDGFDEYQMAHDPHIGLDFTYNAYSKWLRDKGTPEALAVWERLSASRAGFPVPAELHFSRFVADEAIRMIRERPADRPFFLNASFFDPHDPYNDNDEALADCVDEAGFGPALPVSSPLPEEGQREINRYTGVLGGEGGADYLRRSRIGYYGSVALIDREVGRILDCLKAEGLYDNTLIIFASDHGDQMGDHALMTKGGYFYEQSACVPMIVKLPGAQEPRRVSDLVQLNDIAATVLEAAGASEEYLRTELPLSISMLPYARGEKPENARPYAISRYMNAGYSGGQPSDYFDPPLLATMYRRGQYKITLYHSAGETDACPGEIYDLACDPDEQRNLWNDVELRDRLTREMFSALMHEEYTLMAGRGGEFFPGRDRVPPRA